MASNTGGSDDAVLVVVAGVDVGVDLAIDVDGVVEVVVVVGSSQKRRSIFGQVIVTLPCGSIATNQLH